MQISEISIMLYFDLKELKTKKTSIQKITN